MSGRQYVEVIDEGTRREAEALVGDAAATFGMSGRLGELVEAFVARVAQGGSLTVWSHGPPVTDDGARIILGPGG